MRILRSHIMWTATLGQTIGRYSPSNIQKFKELQQLQTAIVSPLLIGQMSLILSSDWLKRSPISHLFEDLHWPDLCVVLSAKVGQCQPIRGQKSGNWPMRGRASEPSPGPACGLARTGGLKQGWKNSLNNWILILSHSSEPGESLRRYSQLKASSFSSQRGEG